ncbi:MAG: acetate--CoA ligase [Myxococcales bacterium]|nr:acetate--CoA ligase [Myxococcales bacterium]MCB9545237.1 acetate--CoA ligase [Myxococcales bacterium]
MSEKPAVHPVPARVRAGSTSSIQSLDDWRREWLAARDDPDGFWLQVTHGLVRWRTPPTEGLRGGFHTITDGPLSWFADGTLNVTETCLDQHLATRSNKPAIIWEGDEPGEGVTLTYRELHGAVGRAANTLKALGVKKGERVIIYMGMVPEAAIAMLACARLGAIHSVVFGGFSAEALRDRVRDCGAELVITQDEGRRGGRSFPLKAVVDEALEGEKGVGRVLVVRRTGAPVPWKDGRDVWWHEAVPGARSDCPAVELAAEDPLFILYTSGSTGRPKGVVHTSGGYLTYAAYTHRTAFDIREDDVYACMADVGWITGHSYIVYGPLANGATTLLFESTPLYPDAGRYWDVVARHRVTVFYTAPTALRALAAHGSGPVQAHDRTSLRVLGTVGEPINPDAWEWYFHVVGEGRCNIVDTWWQTETGGICISPIAPATPTKAGSATRPMPGILPVLMHPNGYVLRGPGEGLLCLGHPWPGQARTVFGDHPRFVQTYFTAFPNLYFTGDGCRRDADGDYWITGRVDDVLNVSGHRLGTAEFESALVSVDAVAEAGVVGYPHPIKGQGVYAYIVLQPGEAPSKALEGALNDRVRTIIGAVARVDVFQFVPGLPKTRSGKVMRRILRKVAEGQPEALGDLSTLADPTVVDAIVAGARVR